MKAPKPMKAPTHVPMTVPIEMDLEVADAASTGGGVSVAAGGRDCVDVVGWNMGGVKSTTTPVAAAESVARFPVTRAVLLSVKPSPDMPSTPVTGFWRFMKRDIEKIRSGLR